MAINGKPGTIEKVDEYTVQFAFPEPYYLFPDVLAGSTALGGHALDGRNAMGALRAGPLPQAVPPEVRRPRPSSTSDGQDGQVRQLGPAVQVQERLGAQPRAAGR